MDVKNSQQNINVNAAAPTGLKQNSTQKTSENNFAEELKNVEKNKETADTKDVKDTKDIKNEEKAKKIEKTEDTKKSDKTDKKLEKEDNNEDNSVDNAIDGLQDVVNEINKIGQKDELDNDTIKQETVFADRKNILEQEDNTLIDNNMNIQEPSEKLNVQTEANMNFNSSEQPFSQFVNQDKSKEVLKSNAKEMAEEKAILSTMEENIAIANKNMLMKQKADETKTKTVQNESGIKKVDTRTNIIVDTIVSYDNVVMNKADVDFFVNLVENGVVNLNEVQGGEKSSQVSKTLADLLAKAMNDNKPIRIDFDNDISVIIKIDRAGKISADFLPSSQIAEAYLKENLPLLKQRFDENNIEYNELNQRKQKQDSQNNRRKGQKDE